MPKEPKHGLERSSTEVPLGVVAIGASAGGLEACQNLLAATPVEHALAFIIVQHLDPTHPSLMVDLLAHHTGMKVEAAVEGAALKARHVYVLPPGTYMTLKADRLSLSPRDTEHGARLPFDILLRSLAQAYGARAQAVILSGTGADGALGRARPAASDVPRGAAMAGGDDDRQFRSRHQPAHGGKPPRHHHAEDQIQVPARTGAPGV